ncbi:hypothetical protein [Planomicrobium sp. CPCC 101110]|uniref:hypothetical protein n=1 Tax=Planomicrobium sp. CPCC 101110 TaxID=2599619 RepID=UPI0011B5211F|nr:hypothetical protein [Planomicrobium sp. CPCC 101110]TWT24909.1 hypothetical protein FQV30_15575 [Planomicrobium sp. CPCC 101110]
MKKTCFFALITLVFAGVFSFPSATGACSCTSPPGVEQEVARSKAVFTGTVLDVREATPFFGAPSTSVFFEVEETWKGVEQSQVMIVTGSGDGDCGSDFQTGTAYLVYAREPSLYGGSHEFESLICSRTNELAMAQEDLAVLGNGAAPTEQVDLTSSKNGQTILMGIIILLALGVSAALILLKRRNS